jgi:hypothetical protein
LEYYSWSEKVPISYLLEVLKVKISCAIPGIFHLTVFLRLTHLRSDLSSAFYVDLLSSQRIFLGTLVTGWLGYSSLGNSLVVGGDFGTAAKYFGRNLRLLFTPPLVAVFGPSIGIRAG